MEFVEIKHEIPIDEYDDKRVDRILKYYGGGYLKDVIFTDSTAILIISAPSSWWLGLIQSVLEPYRYM